MRFQNIRFNNIFEYEFNSIRKRGSHEFFVGKYSSKLKIQGYSFSEKPYFFQKTYYITKTDNQLYCRRDAPFRRSFECILSTKLSVRCT